MLLIFRRSYLGCWGGAAGACRLLWMCYAARGPSGWTTELRKENETCPECLNGSLFFLTIQKSRALHPESPSLWPGTKHLKGWGHRGEDEVAALRGVDCYLPPLSEIHLCAGKQSSEKLVRWWFWVIVSLSFQISNFKSQPLCGSRLSRLHE